MHLTSHSLTHPGLRRESNEDSYTDRLGLGLFIVADGMGGHAAGEVASKVAADTIEAFIEETDGVGAEFTWPFGFDPAVGVDGTRLRTAFVLANKAISARIADEPSLHGMATTAVALLVGAGPLDRRSPGSSDPGNANVGMDAQRSPKPSSTDTIVLPENAEAVRRARGDGGQPGPVPADSVPARPHAQPASPDAGEPRVLSALVAHVGDSRAYLWREGRLEQVTRDHSWVEEQISLGELTEEQARVHPWRNLVTRALAGTEEPLVDLTPLALEPGDRVLLCSDGLCGPVRDDVLAGIIGRARPGDGRATCDALIDAANAAGGPDNITVVLVEIA